MVPLPYGSIKQEEYAAIGRFIVEFSRLEGTIKSGISMLTPLPDGLYHEITAGYDFAMACTVLDVLGRRRMSAEEHSRLSAMISAARSLNNERIRVAHGSWGIIGPFQAKHVSRQKLTVSVHFTEARELIELAENAKRLSLDIFAVCYDAYCDMDATKMLQTQDFLRENED